MLEKMLLGKLDDENHTITVFSGWPVQTWDVSFKLHGAGNTTVEASCVGRGSADDDAGDTREPQSECCGV